MFINTGIAVWNLGCFQVLDAHLELEFVFLVFLIKLVGNHS